MHSNIAKHNITKLACLPDDWIKLKVSCKGYWGYVYSEEILECTDCPEWPEVLLIYESSNLNHTASNTTTLSTNFYTAGPRGVGMMPVPTATPSATATATPALAATPEQTTKLATAGNESGISQTLSGFGVLSLICMLILVIIPRSSAAVGCAGATFDFSNYYQEADIMENNTGVLVLGHGSSLPFNKEVVNAVAEMIGKCNENVVVKIAFLNIENPTLHERLKSSEGTGVNRIVALPLFLAPGVHTTKDIPRVLGIKEGDNRTMIQIGGADVELVYAEPLGADPCIAGMLDYLKNAALKENLENIDFINNTWEDARISGQYDIVVCSHALYFITDMKKSLQRIIYSTGKFLFLMIGVHDSNHTDLSLSGRNPMECSGGKIRLSQQ